MGHIEDMEKIEIQHLASETTAVDDPLK